MYEQHRLLYQDPYKRMLMRALEQGLDPSYPIAANADTLAMCSSPHRNGPLSVVDMLDKVRADALCTSIAPFNTDAVLDDCDPVCQ